MLTDITTIKISRNYGASSQWTTSNIQQQVVSKHFRAFHLLMNFFGNILDVIINKSVIIYILRAEKWNPVRRIVTSPWCATRTYLWAYFFNRCPHPWFRHLKRHVLIMGRIGSLCRLLAPLILPSFISRSFSALIRSSRTDAGSSLGSWGTSFPCIARSSIFWRNAFVSIVIFLFVIVQFWLHNYYSCSSSFFNSSFSSNSSIHSFTLACNKALLGR